MLSLCVLSFYKRKMHIVILGLLVYLYSYGIGADDLCIGLTCYNGGTKTYDSNICKCVCPDGFMGLLCETEITLSEWPNGPYWLVMPKDGCPETRGQGWEKSYIEFSANVTAADDIDDFTFRSRQRTNITGMFGPDLYKINFCYKSVRDENSVPWPNWNFAVFGRHNSCQSEMIEHMLNLTMNQLYHVKTDGHLPDVAINTLGQTSEMKFTLCIHDQNSTHATNISMLGNNPFILVQHPNERFSEIDDVSVYGTWFPLSANSQLDLGYYVPNKTDATGIDKECHAVYERTVDVEIMGNCDTSIYQDSLRDDCFDTAWIMIDLMQTVKVDGVVLYSDFSINYLELGKTLNGAIVEIFIGDVTWNNSRKFVQRCFHSNLFVYTSFFGSSGYFVYKCLRSYEGRFVTIKVDRYTPLVDMDELLVDTLRIYAISCQEYTATNVPLLPCNSDLGVSSYAIEDFQLSASSSYDAYVSSNARLTQSGWQALKSDKLSYIQVDLLVVTVINGIVVYNWYEQDRVTSTSTLFGAAAFRVQYGLSVHNMSFYGNKEDEFIIANQEKSQQFVFYNHFLARFVRIYPRPFQEKRPGLKFELLGCRNFGTPSLSCKGSNTTMYVNSSTMFVPYSATFEYNTNKSTSCSEECWGQGDKCTGIIGLDNEDGPPSCQLVLRNYSSRYTKLLEDSGYEEPENQTITYKTMKICRDSVFRVQYTAMNIEDKFYKATLLVNKLYLPPSASTNVTTPQMLTSFAYPFHYNTNFFMKWTINLVNGFIGLQCTDIYLKENTTDILDKHAGNTYCYEGLFLHLRYVEYSSMFDGQIKELYNRALWFTIDSTFNRKQSYIGTESSRLEMIFRACPQEHYKQNLARGFRVHVQSKDIKSCLTKAFGSGRCMFNRMEIASSSFNDFRHVKEEEWNIQLGSTYQFLRIYVEEISISCISAYPHKSSLLINGVRYCKSLASILPITIRSKEEVKIELLLIPGCVKRYIEGFRLKYDFGIIPFSTQFDFLRNLERRELVYTLDEACFDEFKKCYRFQRSSNKMYSWISVYSLCKNIWNMSILTLASKREMNFLKGYVAINNNRNKIDVFIGLYRYEDGEEKPYEQWIDGRPLTFTDWKEHPKTYMYAQNKCTVMTFMELYTTSWARIDCDYAYSPVSIICERPYTNGNHEEIVDDDDDDDYDVKIIEPNNTSTGFIFITTSCICKSENIAVTWFYQTDDNETSIVRQKTQPGYFEQYTPCHRGCNNSQAHYVSTGFYYEEKSDGILVKLKANITNGLNSAGMKTINTTMLYTFADPRLSIKMINNFTTWHCGNGEYISILARCNNYPECSNKLDENGCDGTCNNNQIRCQDGRCIHVSQICDSSKDCLDSSDEYCDFSSDVEYLPRNRRPFVCSNGQLLSYNQRCDGNEHCNDGSDEQNCDVCQGHKTYKCSNETCIPKHQRCDKYLDCSDGSDEDCSHRDSKSEFTPHTCDDIWAKGHTVSGLYQLMDYEVRCEFGMTYTKMVVLHPDLVCGYFDFRYDVNYNVDPKGIIKAAIVEDYVCTLKVSQVKNIAIKRADIADGALNSSTYNSVFYKMEFVLGNGFVRYIDVPTTYNFDSVTFQFTATSLKDQTLSYFDTSPFQIDPIECIKDIIRPSPKLFCGDYVETASQEEACIYTTDYKGKVGDCRSMEHLNNCESYVCSPGYFKCPGSYCIPQKLMCDGITHCTGNEDEIGCQSCNSTIGTMLIAARVGTDKYSSAFRVAQQLNGTLILFERTAKQGIFEFNAHIYETYFSKLPNPTRCILEREEDSKICIDMILSKLNVTIGGIGLIWIRSPMSTPEEMIFPSALKQIDRIWTITINPLEQYPLTIKKELITEMRLRNIAMLRTVIPDVFADYCNASQRRLCANSYRCSFSRICIPWQQLCDGLYDCPQRDDEQFCDFECPPNCICQGYSVSCEETSYNPLSVLSSTTRKANIRNTLYEHNSLDLEKHLPYLSLLYATNCKIKVLQYGTLQGSRNLRFLDVSYNFISTIQTGAFVYLEKLTVLNLKGNAYLSKLEPDCFLGIKVSSLEIKGTRLRELDANVFSGLNLETLDLSDNNIESIKAFAFANLSVNLLRIERNPISTFNSDLFAGMKSIKIIKASAFKICCVRPFEFPEENCWPHKDEFSSCEDLMRNTTLQALLWTIGLLSLVGNILSMIYRVMFDRKRLKLGYGIFVTNLAIADFLMGVYLLIIAVADKVFRNRYIEVDEFWRKSVWCNIAGLMSTISSEMSVLLICCITVDRILVIKFPFGNFKFTRFSALITVLMGWLLTGILAILPLCGFEYFGTSFYGRSPVCLALPLTRERTPGWQYSVFLFIGLNFILFLLIAFGQLLIYVEIKKNSKIKRLMNVGRSNDLTVARNLLLLVLTDFLCWFPIGCMGIMALRGNYVPIDVYAWTAILILPINSAMNPFLYTYSTILGKKKFNPDVEEQSRITFNREIATATLAVLPYFVMEGGRGRFTVISLREHLQESMMSHRDKVVVVYQLTRCLQCLHCNEMVLGKIDADKILLRLRSSNNSFSMIHLQVPQICRSKIEYAENIYQLGCIVEQLFF